MDSLKIIEIKKKNKEVEETAQAFAGQFFCHIAMCYGCVRCSDVRYKDV